MTIADSIGVALPELRAQAESLMVDTCVVKRPTGVTSGALGEDVTTYATPYVYDGPCKIQDRDLSPREAESGSSTADVLRSELHVPVSAGPFLTGDVVFIDDEATWRVLAPHRKTWQTAQRLPVERVS